MDEISRREALATGAVGLGASLTGCVDGPMHVGRSDLDFGDRSDEDAETHFTFRRGDTDYLTLSAQYHEGYRDSVNQFPFRLSTWHREGTRLDGLRYHLFPSNQAQQFSEFYLRTPSGRPWPEMTLQRDDDGRGVTLDVPDLGFQGTGTVTLDFILEPRQPDQVADPFPLFLDITIDASDESPFGRDYRARIQEEIQLPVE